LPLSVNEEKLTVRFNKMQLIVWTNIWLGKSDGYPVSDVDTTRPLTDGLPEFKKTKGYYEV